MQNDNAWFGFLAIAGLCYWMEWYPFSVEGPLDFQTEYVPEVAYHAGTGTRWWTGDRYRSKSDCLDAARARSRVYTMDSETRVTSISCRVMRGERFLDRTRG